MSVVHRAPLIAALILTILVWPIKHHPHMHGHRQGATYVLKCRLGKPIPAIPLAVRINMDGKICHHVITRFVKLPKQPG